MPETLHKCLYWKKLDHGEIQCDLCPRHCILKSGQRGFCFVRQNIEGELILTTYGRSSGFCIDPIEKKPLNHFYPGTSVLSFGTAGCNLGCRFCQNWDISKSREMDKLADHAQPKQIARIAHEYGCRSVAFTYNDPVIFAEYAYDIADACDQYDIKKIAVTAGYISETARVDFFNHIDAANIDLKAFSESFYKRLCFAELAPVLDTLRYVAQETDVWLELTTLLIPDENDSDQELHQMTEWIVEELGVDVPLHFSAFHPDFKMTSKQRTTPQSLQKARNIAQSKGIRHVFTGNVHDAQGGSSYCHSCGRLLIERDWYELGEYHIQDGHCAFCGASIAGHFENQAGTWGRQRLPLRISDF